eukprot:scaffold2182_cov198-Amphora_coffeaeformis.AAC.16
MLTPNGFINAFGLGTMLWATLGWRGWIYCVLYLFFGQAVTKVRFQEKESKGLAEGRGGRRGPENVWGSAATGLRVEPGTEGAISVEGTAAALVGGLLLSLCGWGLGFISLPAVAISSVAAFVATNIESLLGATLQEKEGLEWITNEVINFMNTAIGAALAIVTAKMLLGM